MSFHVPNKHRITQGPLASRDLDGNNGAFIIPMLLNPDTGYGRQFCVIASDGAGWQHVSTSLPDRCPTWDEMCKIKSIFWDKEDCVVQYHPPESQHINNHNFCLHLWRPIGHQIPTPPVYLVGIPTPRSASTANKEPHP
jgi:hypothetical protein